jgi:beta-galactosidase
VVNGEPNCHESDKGLKRSLFNGLAQLIVQSNQISDEIVIEASAANQQAKITSAQV